MNCSWSTRLKSLAEENRHDWIPYTDKQAVISYVFHYMFLETFNSFFTSEEITPQGEKKTELSKIFSTLNVNPTKAVLYIV